MNEILKFSLFDDYKFFEENHVYEYNGVKVKQSVTSLVHSFETPFDSEKWLPIKAKQAGVTVEQMQAEWKLKADISTNKGTAFHLYAENMLSNKICNNELIEAKKLGLEKIVQEKLDLLYPMFDKFYQDIKGKLIPIKSELVVGVSNIIAGQIDQIFWNFKDQEFQIWDWKTNRQIRNENKFQNFKEPLSHLQQCEINTYSLQLNIYKAILATQGIKIGKCYICWFFEENDKYEIYPCKDMEKEVQKMFKLIGI